MIRNFKCLAFVVAVLSCVIGSGYAQGSTTCSQAASLNFNQTSLFRVWYEAGRQPAKNNMRCVEIAAKLLPDNTTLSLNMSYSNNANSGYQNQEQSANVTLIAGSASGYNIAFVNGGVTQPAVFTKLLNTYQTADGVNWLAGCGYNDPTNPQNHFGFLLSSSRTFNTTGLTFVNNLAAAQYSVFLNSNITAINQNGCTKNSAASAVPLLSGIFAVVYVLMKAGNLV